MAMTSWTRKSLGCAVSGTSCFAVSVRYHKHQRRLHVENAWFGDLADKGFVATLARRVGRKALWVPLSFSKDTDRNDVKLFGIDDNDGKIPLPQAVRTQLSEAEADKQGRYVRVSNTIALGGKRKHTVGASAPAACVDATFTQWRKHGFLNPCIGSVRTAVVNLFLALHARVLDNEAGSVHQILVYQSGALDLFCYLRKKVFVDSGGILTRSGQFKDLLKNLDAWGQQCSLRHQFSKDVKVYIVREDPSDSDSGKQRGDFEYEGVEIWAVPFERPEPSGEERESITYASASVRDLVLTQRKLALPALGLALHGV